MKVIILGGNGFLGRHLGRRYIREGWEVTVVDNMASSQRPDDTTDQVGGGGPDPFYHWFYDRDISSGHLEQGGTRPDLVIHAASIASPPRYQEPSAAVATLKVNARGTQAALELAQRNDARLVLLSTSEVYGSPTVTPQREDYWGNVNPVGPRSMYDEGKRFAEAMVTAYANPDWRGMVDGRIARVFNTYGPGMAVDDGRVVTEFAKSALRRTPYAIFGDGSQTRSFCWVDDTVDAIYRLGDIDDVGPFPVNIGNPDREVTMWALARIFEAAAGHDPDGILVRFQPGRVDDPPSRRPDIRRARDVLDWQPTVHVRVGIRRMLEWAVDQGWDR